MVSTEPWQGDHFSVEGGLLVLDMSELQQAARLGVRVCTNRHGLGQIHLVVPQKHVLGNGSGCNVSSQ